MPESLPDPAEITRLLQDASRGDSRAVDRLLPLVYDELKRVARRHIRRGAARATLSTTELVHEAYLKLVRGAEVGWEGRAHFFGAAARAMRQVLVDFARRRAAAKRGGGWHQVTLTDGNSALAVELDGVLALDDALERLRAVSERLHRVVELRFFGGLGEAEVAKIFGVSPRTVERDWIKARLFLLRELDATAAESQSGQSASVPQGRKLGA